MGWFILSQIFSTILEIAFLRSQTTQANDLEILLLRRQLAILIRKLDKPVRVSRAERLTLAVLAVKLKTRTGRNAKMLNEVIRVCACKACYGDGEYSDHQHQDGIQRDICACGPARLTFGCASPPSSSPRTSSHRLRWSLPPP